MSEPLAARLRRLAEGLPLGGSVTLTRDALFELVAGSDLGLGDSDLTVAEVAALLHVSGSRVRRLLEDHEMAGYKIGGQRGAWRIPRASLTTFRSRGEQYDEPHDRRSGDLGAWRRLHRQGGSA